MANVTFSLEDFAAIYTKALRASSEKRGVPHLGEMGADSVNDFVAFVRQIEEESK